MSGEDSGLLVIAVVIAAVLFAAVVLVGMWGRPGWRRPDGLPSSSDMSGGLGDSGGTGDSGSGNT